MPCPRYLGVLQCVDRLFSLLPPLIFLCHLLGAAPGFSRAAALDCALSLAIKSMVRKRRRKKSYSFVPWKFVQGLEHLKPDYGFPSTHAVFYAGYFFHTPTASAFILMVVGSYSRVLYQHHTLWEVCLSIALTLLSKILVTRYCVL